MQSIEDRLEAIAETVISIPFGGSDESDSEVDHADLDPGPSAHGGFYNAMFTPPELVHRDLPNGPRLRMVAYENAFRRCGERVQETLRELREPTIARVLDAVRDAYRPHDEDRLMSYTELPTIAISGIDRSATAALLEDVGARLARLGSREDGSETGDDEAGEGVVDTEGRTPVLVSTLSPADCSNLTSTLKTLISGFMTADPDILDEDQVQDVRVSRSLAPYDMNLLKAWFDRVRQTRSEAELPKLVVLMNDLEKIEPTLVQDLFYICSLHIPDLPLVFILGLSTPPPLSYLHAVYPRTTLTLLRLTRVEVQGGMEVLERVLLDIFFDTCFAPVVYLSPTALSLIVERFKSTVQSIDFVLSVLQLILLRHFVDPFTILTADELLGETTIERAAEKLSTPEARPFLLSLLARLNHTEKISMNGNGDATPTSRLKGSRTKGKEKEKEAGWLVRTPLEALRLVRAARDVHEQKARGARVAFRLVLEVKRHLVKNGVLKEGEEGRKPGFTGACEMMAACLRGTIAGREGKVIAGGIRKLAHAPLSALLSDLYAYMHALPVAERSAENETMVRIVGWDARLSGPAEEADASSVAVEMSDWLSGYMNARMKDFTETNMWDLWYTGNPHGIMELFNPAPRAAIISALVHPERYLDDSTADGTDKCLSKEERREYIGKLVPDTSILFQRYLESGRMLNVYDWYSAFSDVLDGRRAAHRRKARDAGGSAGNTDVAPGTVSVSEPSADADVRSTGKRKAKNIRDPRIVRLSPSPSPTKRRGRGRGRGGGRIRGGARTEGENVGAVSESDKDEEKDEESDGADDESPDAKERWQGETQARFIRSVQELDFLGFLKHTGRKADHVHKTVYDPLE
ncbi:hypothetical protein M0805_000238 [Coniferiporia weirii]|nr:hypothetical protein M0805_000238 [Coniferiporia weirii]